MTKLKLLTFFVAELERKLAELCRSFDDAEHELDAAVAQVTRLTRERDEALRRPTLECARATEAEVARLTAALAAAERATEAAVAGNALATQRARDAESECAALRADLKTWEQTGKALEQSENAEVERLRALNAQAGNAHAAAVRDRGFADEQRRVAESRLADANALLERIFNWHGPHGLTVTVMNDIRAHLAAQPAPTSAPVAYRCGSCRDTGKWSNGIDCPVCEGSSVQVAAPDPIAAAERRVLDIVHDYCRINPDWMKVRVPCLSEAELALREAKR